MFESTLFELLCLTVVAQSQPSILTIIQELEMIASLLFKYDTFGLFASLRPFEQSSSVVYKYMLDMHISLYSYLCSRSYPYHTPDNTHDSPLNASLEYESGELIGCAI